MPPNNSFQIEIPRQQLATPGFSPEDLSSTRLDSSYLCSKIARMLLTSAAFILVGTMLTGAWIHFRHFF
jgi:hypothetical protein